MAARRLAIKGANVEAVNKVHNELKISTAIFDMNTLLKYGWTPGYYARFFGHYNVLIALNEVEICKYVTNQVKRLYIVQFLD